MADATPDDSKLADEFVDEEDDDVKDADDEVLSSSSEWEDEEGDAGGEELTFEVEDIAGEEFMSVKPWLGAIKEPSDFTAAADAGIAPDKSLELERVFGYRCRGVFDNVAFAKTGEVVYPTAAVVVVANAAEHTQRFYQGHVDDVMCLAVNSTGTIAATGGKATVNSRGRRELPTIHVWDLTTGETICEIKGKHKRAISCLAFSPDDKTLVSVGGDNQHTMTLNEVATGRQIASVETGTDTIFAVEWSGKTGYIVTAGVRHCSFWSSSLGRPKKALYGRKGSRCTQLCLAETAGGRTWSGTATGHIYMYRGNRLFATVEAHAGHVTALASTAEYMISGGKDGKVNFWSVRGELIGSLNVGAAVRAIGVGADGRLGVGTAKGQVFSVTLGAATAPAEGAEMTLVTTGHFDGETWALAVNPDGNLAITGGDDNMLAVWNLEGDKLLTSRTIDDTASEKSRRRARKKGGGRSTMADSAPNQCCRAVDWGPNGTIAVGTNDGRVLLLDESDLSTVAQANVSRQAISVVRFDPIGDFLAIGSADSKAYIYSVVEGELSKVCECRGNSSYITALDWDEDGTAIQTTSGAYELLFYNAETGEQDTMGATLYRDQPWATWTSTLGWPVQGIWYKFSKGSDINTCCRDPEGTLLAVGDDRGRIRLFNYPCYAKKAESKTYRGHASHLTCVRFTGTGKLLSVGGNDNALMKWNIV